MAAPITFDSLVGYAIANPLAICESVLVANPVEVEALGAVFRAAGASTAESAMCALEAAQLADAAGMIDDKTPVQLMAEVTATKDTLDVNSAQLDLIGGLLSEVGSQIHLVQAKLNSLLDMMYAEIATAASMYECAVPYDPANDAALHEQCAQAALASINTTATSVNAVVDGYDAFLTDHLATLQEDYGYVPPAALNDGAALGNDPAYVSLTTGMPGASAPPGQVQQWWNERSAAEKVWLIDNEGAALSMMHGLPALVLNLVNRRELTDDASSIDAQVAMVETQKASLMQILGVSVASDVFDHPDIRASNPGAADELAGVLPVLAALKVKQANIHGVEDGAKAVAMADGTAIKTYLLDYDDLGSADDGEAVIAIGNPDEAADIAVIVPGTTSSARTMSDYVGSGGNLYAEMNDVDPDSKKSVIAYLGMDAPDTLPDASLPIYANEAAPELAADIAGYTESNLVATGADPHVTVIGHSYGSLVVGAALESGDLIADDVIFVGSPGVGVKNVDELNMDGSHVYVGLLPDDAISNANDFFDMKAGSTLGVPDGAWFGHNPARESFGGTVFDTDTDGDHGDYFDYGTTQLDNMAAVATGQYDEVTLD
ncbi:alpha/beta hydrolase family protein [Antricoccus suffuscus]|uniref:Alpha/beta hydrolase family protein n=1 Tax=Antricoccus suffuscus TaxID=1629062 RepID=A0A2T1A099_9ACTN|nr:alpha/beta hydrolase [Antricoccus suffuscus]PRZ41954.1 alpha/beta hydrolase family protein [Antricoccus suffuscus]